MNNPTILVAGATGKTGGAVVDLLLARGYPVRAAVRGEDARSAALRARGAETSIVDVFDADQWFDAMKGAQRVYHVGFFDPFMVQSAAAFAVAARQARLESVVQLSQWLAGPHHPALATRQSWLIDQMFAAIPGIAHTIVNPGYFADNYLRLMDFAAVLGVLPVLTGDSKNAPPANEDIARVAVAALADPDRHGGKRYRPTGLTLMSAYDMVPVIGSVLGRRVRAFDMPWWMFNRAARLQGVAPADLVALRHYIVDHEQGAFAYGAPNDVVAEVTGTPAEPFEVTVTRYAGMPFARRTGVNRRRVIRDFLRTPLRRGFDLERYEMGEPPAPNPRYAMQDEQWKARVGGQ
ncbi:NmrA family NAD(P)-binding protein [Mycolicibacterium hodleri]|uniref:NAD-dependent epimerase/dehydratase family protein n=1 Tax=Mycolicibacterium hodleri TaxID=49897 RepID=A0A502EH84_9MYCO|nr:NmrA family NAD(P)-binding protein [Mycolicibacterium hodleri]TPG35856.1 NAD-dependent epimerase/dehydratase family protein [Mycolicibacterium hodleri]